MKFLLRIAVFFAVALPAALLAQAQPTASQLASTKGLKLDTGEEIFKAACIGCHGPDGSGQPQAILGFEPPATFPDFTDCNASTRERTGDWSAILHEGGPIRAFSEIMPSWKDALTSEQIDKLTAHLRTFCDDPSWPLGELNVPRAIFTEKAFPEDEWILMTAVDSNGSGRVSGKLLYEKRFGARNQVEVAAPYSFIEGADNGWDGGIGDLAFGYKRVLMSRGTRSIFSVQGEVIVPTGNRSKGMGSGVTIFEPFATFAQTFPGSSFFQMQTGFEFPTDTTRAPNVFFWRGVLGKSFTQNGRVGRAWTPMAEFLAERDLATGSPTNWDIVPEMQVTLNKRQHVRLNVGVRTPMTHRAGRPTQIALSVLWDFFDGGLREGW